MSFSGWEQNGFTVTMWVRFLNTSSGGTLFTYGNPHMRGKSSFRLETMIKQPGDEMWAGGTQGTFVYAKPTRVLRLVVWENVKDQWMLDQAGAWSEDYDFDFTYINPSTGGPRGIGQNPDSPVYHERRFGYLYDSSVPYDIPESDYEFIEGSGNGSWPFPGGFKKIPSWFTQTSAIDHRDRSSPFRKNTWNFTQYTKVPTDNLNEWFFVCATYDPSKNEVLSFPDNTLSHSNMVGYWEPYGRIDQTIQDIKQFDDFDTSAIDGKWGVLNRDEMYWLNHKNPANNEIVSSSDFGNRCKVEIISRSDLLRARGYKVD